MKAQQEHEKREQERQAHLHHLQNIREHQDSYWHHVDTAVARNSGAGYEEAVRILIELREAANHFQETQNFQASFLTWVRPHMRRPALMKRLLDHKFTLPQG